MKPWIISQIVSKAPEWKRQRTYLLHINTLYMPYIGYIYIIYNHKSQGKKYQRTSVAAIIAFGFVVWGLFNLMFTGLVGFSMTKHKFYVPEMV